MVCFVWDIARIHDCVSHGFKVHNNEHYPD